MHHLRRHLQWGDKNMKHRCASLLALLLMVGLNAEAAHPSLEEYSGVWRVIPNDMVLPGALRNHGSPEDVTGLPPGQDLSRAELVDPLKACQPIGPFRMMARTDNLLEIIPSRGELTMLFQDASHGYWRVIYLEGNAGNDRPPSFQGYSIGQLKDAGLTVTTSGFSGYVWLNALGWRHSGQLKLEERLRIFDGGKHLEYRASVSDPGSQATHGGYVRYFKRTNEVLAEDDSCEIDLNAPEVRPGI